MTCPHWWACDRQYLFYLALIKPLLIIWKPLNASKIITWWNKTLHCQSVWSIIGLFYWVTKRRYYFLAGGNLPFFIITTYVRITSARELNSHLTGLFTSSTSKRTGVIQIWDILVKHLRCPTTYKIVYNLFTKWTRLFLMLKALSLFRSSLWQF